MIFENLSYSRQGKFNLPVLNGELPPCSIVGLLGQNGSGKSTLLLGFSGSSLIKKKSGSVLNQNKQPIEAKYLGNSLEVDFDFKVSEVILMAQEYSINKSNLFCEELLSAWGLSHLKSRYVNELSSGEKQRLNVVRMLILDPPVYCFDESFSAMDIRYQGQAIVLMKSLCLKGRDVFVVAHDLNFLVQACDHFIALTLNMAKTGTSAEMLTEENLQNIFAGVNILIQKSPWRVQIIF